MQLLTKLALTTWLFFTQAALATEIPPWSEGGHHVIAELAFSLLTEDEQQHLVAILSEHPRFAEDFKAPDALTSDEASPYHD